ncbi:hypothetical protein E4413_14590 [Leptospira interrogans]|uniref:hypothetical protein n=1 Tax=Leptospira interrogans TaxID=173 RepID=UPI00030A9BC4|nr:hypothetical protein [Leptospira interrogans]KAA1290054.1 hypothetical protein C4X99_06155 [Leptospira interrogans serovar Geyaweera]QCO36503.1 hypothetical protein E4412_04150 [Leptospira interrogans]QCO41994.1 hypothetical protein E4413_14590 [Leptospira interrogans]ULG91150.1 hypothetical protein FH584_10715 [Leptospira interrogans]UML77003.1 hypothetical protein FH583_05500 [Leptospira interrogans]
MSRKFPENPASFSDGFKYVCLMRRIYFLFLSISVLTFHSVCVPADPEYRHKVLENIKDTGFISREFFQILVKVPLPTKDMGIKELRNQCRKIAETKRDEMAVSILLKEIRGNELIFSGPLPPDLTSSLPPALPGQITTTTAASSAVPGSIAVSGSTGANPTTNPNQSTNQTTTATNTATSTPDPKAAEKNKEKEKQLAQDVLVYRGAFAWFLNSMFLFREDYTDATNCTFIYRNIQKDLYANVIRKGLKPISKEEVSEAP